MVNDLLRGPRGGTCKKIMEGNWRVSIMVKNAKKNEVNLIGPGKVKRRKKKGENAKTQGKNQWKSITTHKTRRGWGVGRKAQKNSVANQTSRGVGVTQRKKKKKREKFVARDIKLGRGPS